MTKNERSNLAENMSAQAQKVQQIIADAEKMDHIAKTIQKASVSIESHDKTLENIMLSHNPKITSGPLNIEKTDKTIIATFADMKYDITEFSKPQNEVAKIAELPLNIRQAKEH